MNKTVIDNKIRDTAFGLAAMLTALLLNGTPLQAGDYARYYDNLPTKMDEPAAPQIPDNTVILTDFDAVPDGITLNTRSIQSAIDLISSRGGGVLEFPAGKYLSAGLLCL